MRGGEGREGESGVREGDARRRMRGERGRSIRRERLRERRVRGT
jgi:hypothetical protein